ncbi:hypothetical protein ACN9MJ_24080 [Acidovorax facilis]|uniref:hypothetical protein n=1 Tax=Acidovorax facilis TaxID=12917 RepID=UPI003CF1C4A9
MTTLIPAIGSSAFDSTGKRRLAERLEQKLDADYLLKGVGVQAQGRTASLVAADLLTADDKDDDGIPLLKPVSCGGEGQAPVIIKLPTLRDEAFAIADQLASAHKEGYAWGDMALVCADWKTMDLCASALAQRKLPHSVRKKSVEYRPVRMRFR